MTAPFRGAASGAGGDRFGQRQEGASSEARAAIPRGIAAPGRASHVAVRPRNARRNELTEEERGGERPTGVPEGVVAYAEGRPDLVEVARGPGQPGHGLAG